MIGWLMNVEQVLEFEVTGKTDVLGENLLHCHFSTANPT
jgi:hypothetical protein